MKAEDWVNGLKLQYLHGRILPGSRIPLGGSTSHPTGVGGKQASQDKDARERRPAGASASSCVGLASSDRVDLPSFSHVAKSEKTNKSRPHVKMNYPSCPTWQRGRFSCPVENLSLLFLTASNHREADAVVLPAASPRLMLRRGTWPLPHHPPDMKPAHEFHGPCPLPLSFGSSS